MAEVALAAFSAVGSAATAATTALSSSIVPTVLSGIATAGSVISQLGAANQQRQAGEFALQESRINAQLAEVDGDRAVLQSEARALDLRREALQKIAATRVAFAGSGLDLSSGQLAGLEGAIEDDVEFKLDIERQNQRIATAETALKRDQILLSGQNAAATQNAKASSTRVGAFTTAATGLLNLARRG